MSPNVFLAPSDPTNFDRTVRSAVDLGEYPDRPDELPDGEAVRFWGAPEGASNHSSFEKMESGDLLLFYHDGTYVGTGRVGTTVVDEDGWANDAVWDDAPSTHLYTVEEFSPISVPKAAVNALFEYTTGYSPQGLMRVSPRNVDNRLEAIELALAKYDEKYD